MVISPPYDEHFESVYNESATNLVSFDNSSYSDVSKESIRYKRSLHLCKYGIKIYKFKLRSAK